MADNLIMDEDIFGDDVDIDDIPDNPNHLPEDTYICRITKAEMRPTKNNAQKIGLTITYQIDEGEYASAWPFTEWLEVVRKKVEDCNPDEKKAYSRMKKHFKAWGYPADSFKGVKPADLVGKYCKVRTRNKKDKDDPTIERINVTGVFLVDDSSGESLNDFTEDDNDI